MSLFCLYFVLVILPSPQFVNATASDPDAQVALVELEKQYCGEQPAPEMSSITTEPTYGAQEAQ